MEEVISSSRNYDELTYVWKSWRGVSGAKMRDDYKKYVELSNRAASLNGRPTSDRGLSVSKTQADAMYCHRFVSLEILLTNAVFYVSVNVCMHYLLLCGDAGRQSLDRITSYAS
jgi:hypothetical protein